MSSRQIELANLEVYLDNVDKEITMILQNLQWDRSQLIQGCPISTCKYDINHKMPSDKIKKHEEMCFLKCHGYSKNDQLLPEPFNTNSNGLVKLNSESIQQILQTAAQQDYQFKTGQRCTGPEPLTLERLQVTYTADERRAIHDAVVNAVPSCHDLSELALPSGGTGEAPPGRKSRLEVLAELRDMKRRRAKYRVPARTNRYSDVLRNVIKTQMELYSEALLKTNKFGVKQENKSELHAKKCNDRPLYKEPKEKNRYEDETSEYRSSESHSDRRKYEIETFKYHERDTYRKVKDEMSHINQERIDHEKDKLQNERFEKYSYSRNHRHNSDKRYTKSTCGERDRHRSHHEDNGDKNSSRLEDNRHRKSSRLEKNDSNSNRDREGSSYKKYEKEGSQNSKDNDSNSKTDRDRLTHSQHEKESSQNTKDNHGSYYSRERHREGRRRDDVDEVKNKRRNKHDTSDLYESKEKYRRYYD